MKFRDVDFPETLQYSSDSKNIPLEFYENTFPIAKEIDLLLGYFSSNAFKVLSKSFAEFIFNGGSMRIITNHIFSFKDKENLLINNKLDLEDEIIDIFGDLEKLEKELSDYGKHFFDCLKYLITHNRLKLLPVKFNHFDLAHCKKMILYDGSDYISTDGSINFTMSALIKNSESFSVNVPWKGEIFHTRNQEAMNNFNLIFSKQHSDYKYLEPEEVEGIINKIGKTKEIQELLEDSIKLDNSNFSKKIKSILELKKVRFEKKILELKTISKEPKFPYPKPHDYQIEAWKAWEQNNNVGLFAMATGTGKTLTALYCLIQEFKKNRVQKNIIVVPGKELVSQWYNEFKQTNFSTPIKWYSGNLKLKKNIEYIKLLKHKSNFNELNIVITYKSFASNTFKTLFKDILKDFIVVFDETHNMGAEGFMSAINNLELNKRIGLSATPLRLWDENNENQFIENFFHTCPPYTYSYSMEDAIKNGYLCKYHYEPFFVNFSDEEWEKYLKLTQQLHNKKENETINTKAALKRQLLKDQASAKGEAVIEIIENLIEKDSFKNTLIYCAKGVDNKINDRYIHILQEEINKKFPILNTATFLGETINRDLLLKDFEDETVHMLLAIKCLDEGVNIPKTINAIFIASGQNYREFVQRRGRVLRNYKTKEFKKDFADIFDVVVLPSLLQFNNDRKTAERLIISEFRRLYEFYNLADDKFKTHKKIKDVLKKYSLTEGYIRNQVNDNNKN
jgi:superfamily II DNA or RNA helicase